MLKSVAREKLINAVLFFARINKCDKRKLMALLYLLDTGHFAQTGQSVTGLEYAAWQRGPVPIDFESEWDDPDEDLANAVGAPWERGSRWIEGKQDPNIQYFTARELELMMAIAKSHMHSSTDEIEALTRDSAWQATFAQGVGDGQVIDYALTIPSDSPYREELLEVAREAAAMKAAARERVRRLRHPA